MVSAWLKEGGQYGSDNHWVACKSNQPIGIVTCWHDELPEDFDHKTLACITEYFGVTESLNVIARSQQFAESLQSPDKNQLGVGHVAVHPEYRRAGVATALLQEMEKQAIKRAKHTLILDVETHNEAAIAFYIRQGFKEKSVEPPFLHMYKTL
nr:GNAT family N-acetyltransferase [Alteromonas sp. ASW11-130]